MIEDKIKSAATKLRALAGEVRPEQWEAMRAVVQDLDQAAKCARCLERQLRGAGLLAEIVRAMPEITDNH